MGRFIRDGVRYKKLRSGERGVTGPASMIVEGQWVTVQRWDGSYRKEFVEKLLWRGDGSAIATIRKISQEPT